MLNGIATEVQLSTIDRSRSYFVRFVVCRVRCVRVCPILKTRSWGGGGTQAPLNQGPTRVQHTPESSLMSQHGYPAEQLRALTTEVTLKLSFCLQAFNLDPEITTLST